jgi:acyl dehydratase
MSEGLIDDFIESSGRLIGSVASDVERGVTMADWLAIHRFVEATGDENPLFLDPRYGATSAQRTMVAPPTFVLAVQAPESTADLYAKAYGFLPLLNSMRITWEDQIRLGDRLGSVVRISGVSRGPAWAQRTTADVTSEADYSVNGRPAASAQGVVRMYPIERGAERFVDREIHRYSVEEIDELVKKLESEPARRGATPRLWDLVNAGDPLPELVKGPLTLGDLITWAIAEAVPVKAGNLVHKDLMGHPGRTYTNPRSAWPFYDVKQMREDLFSCGETGLPAPFGRGTMRVALAGQLITHWMGDDAFLRELDVSLPGPFIYGDTMTLGGEVAGKHVEGQAHTTRYCVEIAISGRNQLGENILEGQALVYLPSRGEPVVPPAVTS